MPQILLTILSYAFNIYYILLLVRVLGSWFPEFARSKFMHFVAFYTDPYLNLFRRFIPPIGGMLDISPIIAFIALRILQTILFSLLT